MKQPLKMRINAIIQSFDVHTKKITKTSRVHNLIVDDGLNEVIDNGLSNIAFIAIGTNNAAAQASDVALGTEVQRLAVTKSNEGTGIRLYDKTYTFGSGEDYTIVEAGLFNSLTPSGSTMFNRLVFSGHEVDINNGVRVKITVTFANA